jgi:hypothetical protein
MKPLTKTQLIAPCGMNCGVCLAYLREINKCNGCRMAYLNKPFTRVRCRIKNCDAFQNGKSRFCFECQSFPCARLKHLDNRYLTKYHMSMIENLENIKAVGIRQFTRNEAIRWACSKCGGSICVHRGYCISCRSSKAQVE